MKRLLLLLFLFFVLLAGARQPVLGQSSPQSVTAEPINEANLRASTDVASLALGQIRAGTRYLVVGRSALYPWLLLADATSAQPLGWVYVDLLTVSGDVSTVPTSSLVVTANPTPAPPAATATAVPDTAAPGIAATEEAPGIGTDALGANDTGNALNAPSSTRPASLAVATATPVTVSTGVTGTARGEINVRYGPAIEYPRLGVGQAGDTFPIVGWHTQLPWVRIAYPSSPTGEAWVAADLLTIGGDLYSLPASSATTFALPTLTPTPSALQESSGLRELGVTPPDNTPAFTTLGDTIWNQMLSAGFDPATSQLGAFFLMNLGTGESVTYGDDVAFSGMSVNKIAILATYFARLNAPPNDEQAFRLAEAMVCSENISTNEMLSEIGDGDPYLGAVRVSDFLDSIGLTRTFLYTPYANDPFVGPPTLAINTRVTSADQVSAQPDPYNQLSVSEIGGLLYSLYDCGYGTDNAATNPLFTRLPEGTFTASECRRILRLMSFNRIGELIEVGVPAEVRVSHKHGWIDDTHGDAAVVFSPSGAYVFVMVMHGPIWLDFSQSSAVIEEASREIYNFFNPDAPLAEVRPNEEAGDVAACNAALLGSPVIEDVMNSAF